MTTRLMPWTGTSTGGQARSPFAIHSKVRDSKVVFFDRHRLPGRERDGARLRLQGLRQELCPDIWFQGTGTLQVKAGRSQNP